MTVTGRNGSSKGCLACVAARESSPAGVLLDLTKQESTAMSWPGFVCTGGSRVARIHGAVRGVDATHETAPVKALGSVLRGAEA